MSNNLIGSMTFRSFDGDFLCEVINISDHPTLKDGVFQASFSRYIWNKDLSDLYKLKVKDNGFKPGEYYLALLSVSSGETVKDAVNSAFNRIQNKIEYDGVQNLYDQIMSVLLFTERSEKCSPI